MDELLEILKNIVKSVNADTEEYSKKLYEIYKDEEFRHSYAELSKFFEYELASDQRDQMIGFLDDILKTIDLGNIETYPEKSIAMKKIGKLVDHLELEAIRLSRLEGIMYIGKKVSKSQQKIENNMRESAMLSRSLKKSLRNTNAQLVSVLGIFSGIVLAVFGGLSFFSSVFNNIDKIGNYKLVFVTALTGFTLFNVISFLLAVIAYLTDKPFPLMKLSKEHNPNIKKFYKNAYIFVNIIFVLIMVVTVILWVKPFCC